jgi:hypothetical protein
MYMTIMLAAASDSSSDFFTFINSDAGKIGLAIGLGIVLLILAFLFWPKKTFKETLEVKNPYFSTTKDGIKTYFDLNIRGVLVTVERPGSWRDGMFAYVWYRLDKQGKPRVVDIKPTRWDLESK